MPPETPSTRLAIVGTACTCAKPKPTPPPEVKAAPPAPTPVPVKQEEFKPAPVEKPVVDELAGDLERLNKAGYLKDAFFDFDKFNVRADQRDTLAADAEWLKKYPKVKIQIEGHCDERGSDGATDESRRAGQEEQSFCHYRRNLTLPCRGTQPRSLALIASAWTRSA